MDNFMLGASTAAYQVEGNNIYSDFWTMEQLEHTSFVEKSGDAVDQYNRYEEDIKLMKDAGMNAYRFSIEWARIEQKKGVYDTKETEHYRKVIMCCKENGLTPVVTLHHFSSPKWLIEEGGWNSEKTVEYFKNYAVYLMEQFGEELEYICTINEANMRMQMAIIMQSFAKNMGINLQVGVNFELPEKYMVGKREEQKAFGVEQVNTFLTGCTEEEELIILKAHEAARNAIKELYPNMKVGLTLSLHDVQPLEDGEKYAAKCWYEEFVHYVPYLKEDDFIGVQNYTRMIVNEDGEVPLEEGVERTQMGYEFYPYSLQAVIRRVHSELDKPILVTENGVATDNDERRVFYIQEALKGIKECMADGIEIWGYLHWSLLDNFEWQQGYSKTFGLIVVDRTTQVRSPKKSLYAIVEKWNQKDEK